MKREYLFFKRIFDIIGSLIFITICVVPWIIIGIIIRIQSPGPIIYKAKRVGLNGNVFILYKFRTMKVNSGTIRSTTLRNDDRIFSFGRFLRKSKLDETPQLLNILKGDMSIIGPRPEDEYNFDKFYIGKYKKIVSVKPGLSSPASLYDYTHGEMLSNEAEYVKEFLPKKLDVELYYIQNKNLLYDFQIIIRTIVTILEVLIGKKNFKEPREIKIINRRKYEKL
ncbi:sugar transferase [Coprobacillus sp. AF13-15]|uniref:sugar transferase n=1 Tax=Faecalibacillus intestinalis TaxID=1982626 RepID=UPI000E499B95|nr:sugar transferase [Coprobacillus sp. AF13-4LB]RHS15509.1 sugar transferase [Coprobacillus sp. AF13-25]RHS15655.1 sugar transferase [Coprobacillus sp. AF13-15]